VPEGKDANDNVVVKTWGKKRTIKFELQNHAELLERAGLADFETARKASGQGFNYLLGEMALLDLALQRYGIDLLLKNGFILVVPPMLLRYETLSGVLNGLKDFEEVVYKIEQEDAYLIGTAEHSLVAFFRDKIIKEKEFPVKVCAVTPCFRKEIGAHGVDTKGLFRMHQFNKVEQVVITKPEDSFKMLEQMQSITEKFFQSLDIPYRVVEICSGDIGAKTAKQYDIEAWFPRQKVYREVTSASNCTDYQARSLNIKYEGKGGEKKYVHMLNNTMVATSRAMVAILENFQQEDGSIELPKVLQPYMNGLKKLNAK
jgi:seryl-tRNA synthetase